MAEVASIVPGPTTGGFERGGRPTGIDLSVWGDSAKFIAGPCDAPNSFVNKQSVCDGLIDDDTDPKIENATYLEAFYPWPVYEIQSCVGDDIVKESDLRRVTDRLNSVRSSKFAQEISAGVSSGSPTFKSSAVPISDTAYTLTQAIARLLDVRVGIEAAGPHVIHLPVALAPLASGASLVSSDVYSLVFDNYVKSYIPDEDIYDDSGAASAPTANQAWIAITGGYEYGSSSVETQAVTTVDARRANKRLIRAEQQLFYRYETCNTFLAKVTVFS